MTDPTPDRREPKPPLDPTMALRRPEMGGEDLLERLQQTERLAEDLHDFMDDLAWACHVELVVVYGCSTGREQLEVWYSSDQELIGTAVPVDASSIAGYAAMRQEAVLVDEFNSDLLESLDPVLSGVEPTHVSGRVLRAVAEFPMIRRNEVAGVVELVNPVGNNGQGTFADEDIHLAQDLADLLRKRIELLDRVSTPMQGGSPYDSLVEERVVTQERLDECKQLAARSANVSVGKQLLSLQQATPAQIASCLEEFYGVPFYPVLPTTPVNTSLLEELNQGFLIRRRWLPLAPEQGQSAVVVIDDPSDQERVEEIERLLGTPDFQLRVGLPEDIVARLVAVHHGPEKATGTQGLLDDMVENLEQVSRVQDYYEEQVTDLLDENVPMAVKVVHRLIVDAIKAGASDLHIEPCEGQADGEVRIRVDGVCQQIVTIPNRQMPTLIARIKVMGNMDIADRRLPQDGKLAVMLGKQRYELRVATIPTIAGESVVLRILAVGDALEVEDLNLEPHNFQALMGIAEQPHGLFLVVGPTGSGKTTTLHSILRYLNTTDTKIWTAEDPVEISQKGLQQVQVAPKIGLTFARALRSFLRADPDIILIGEIRDLETAHAAIEASLTGHLVLSTLHTNSAPETITRLLDMGLDPFTFADSLLGVLAQRLVRRLCKECRQEAKPDKLQLEEIALLYGKANMAELGPEEELRLYRAPGCSHCLGTGYRGRTAIHELMVASLPVKRLVGHGGKMTEIAEAATREGMRRLRQDGVVKALRGETDLSQVRGATLRD